MNKFVYMAMFAVLGLALCMVFACGGDDDDSSDDSSSSDDATGDDSGGGGGDFQAAKYNCVATYVSCGIPESAATQACSFLDTYSSYWNDCFATALNAYFDCLGQGNCINAADCATTFSTDAGSCY